ncbi:MAG: accessory factor UbiK family protein [Alphaproteobacteria bacterium]|nr:accessory factor UbiK family protein [Alphaproteobacteria bacterium]
MQTSNRFLDEIAKMATNAAGAARGLQQEVEAIVRGQAERLLGQMDLVNRDAFEAVKAMAVKAREENEALAGRIAALEAELAALKAR